MEEKRRSPLIASIASLIDPGLGLVYNVAFKKGIIVTISFLVAVALLFIVGALKSFVGGLIVVSFYFIARIYFIIDSFWRARKYSQAILTRFNRWYFYATYILLSVLASYFVTSLSPTKSFQVPTSGMEPAILAEDVIVADMNYYHSTEVKVGDIVVFRYPRDPRVLYIKRCVALSGQTFEIRDGLTYLNGSRSLPTLLIKRGSQMMKPADFKDPRISPPGSGNEDQYGPVTVPEGQLFMLGDYRDNSLDSRYFGFVDRNAVVGKAAYVYWSSDFSNVGKTLQWQNNGN